ncbi:MAG TPA: hypothetical protein VLR89_05480 [Anaerolineaceae bacterium]|nr:hypothetical protein [Anaerolineaceae bacterium]
MACTVNISSVAIPTSIATLVKTVPPMATLQMGTPASSLEAPIITSEPNEETEPAPQPTLSPSPSATRSIPSSTPGTSSINEDEGLASLQPVFFLNTGSSIIENQNFIAAGIDETCVYVNNGASLGLVNPRIQKSGPSSSADNSLRYGLNSASLVRAGSRLRLENPKLTTDAPSAIGAFALGQGAQLTIAGGTLDTTSASSPGVVVAAGATAEISELQLSTKGENSPGTVVGLGSGSLNIRGGKITTSGANSPCYLSWGTVFADANTCAVSGAGIAEVDGTSTIAFRNVNATAFAPEYGILLYRSGQNQTQAGNSNFSAEGGNLGTLNNQAPLFLITNTQAQVTLKDVKTDIASGIFLSAIGDSEWGLAEANGGVVSLTLVTVNLTGNIFADRLSSISLNLSANSAMTGAINQAGSARFVSLTMDATSSWTMTGTSYINRLIGIATSGNTVQGIIGNGFTLYYDPIQSPSLGGNTYSLSGGGSLTPAN